MNLLELHKIFEGKYIEKREKEEKQIQVTEENVIKFRELLMINDSFTEGLNRTESAVEYFKTYELLDKVVSDDLKEELFYIAKTGFFFEGIPSKVVYLLQRAIKKYNTPNNAISSIDIRVLNKYLKKGYLPESVTLKQVMENLIGREFQTLSEARLAVPYKDCIEVYVRNTDRVLIIPNTLEGYFNSREDLESVEYKKNIGVCIQDIPIRTLKNRLGITFNEYDLRECQ